MNETAGQVILWLGLGLSWLSILLGLPGTVLMLAAAVIYGWATGFREITGRELAWLAALALPVEVLDQLLGFWAARRYGATWIGMAGAFVGAIVGASVLGGVLPLLGVVPGALLGSFAGAFAAEYATRRDSPAALRAAWGGFLGKIAGIALKMSAGLVMAGMVYRALR